MPSLLHAFREALSSLRRDLKRVLPMALGIVWGMASVMVLLAVANGFEATQKQALAAYGDRFLLLRLNRAELDRAAGGKERRIRMDLLDIERLRKGAPAIRHLSPMNMAYRARLSSRGGSSGSNIWIAGVLPEITKMRNIPIEEGRFFDDLDEAERRRVIVLGPMARKQLFGSGPALGQTVRVSGFSTSLIAPRDAQAPGSQSSARGSTSPSSISSTSSSSSVSSSTSSSTGRRPQGTGTSSSTTSSSSSSSRPATVLSPQASFSIAAETFTVIGVLADVEAQKEAYVSVARNAFVPFSTSTAVFDRRFITIFIEPWSIEQKDLALRQFREVMGARYGFAPTDRNAVVVYFDGIERARSIAAIFGGVRVFFSAVGALILAIGGIGVMNVVLVSVASRTFEIGLRKALGATPFAIYVQFFLETVVACLSSGLLGFLLGAGTIALLSALPL
ncbi:MAG TPA: ABC transporter permease, partial [Planctomycetota bacterium]|nr:ABC transporter permease [Planctomycetota bacterium]